MWDAQEYLLWEGQDIRKIHLDEHVILSGIVYFSESRILHFIRTILQKHITKIKKNSFYIAHNIRPMIVIRKSTLCKMQGEYVMVTKEVAEGGKNG